MKVWFKSSLFYFFLQFLGFIYEVKKIRKYRNEWTLKHLAYHCLFQLQPAGNRSQLKPVVGFCNHCGDFSFCILFFITLAYLSFFMNFLKTEYWNNHRSQGDFPVLKWVCPSLTQHCWPLCWGPVEWVLLGEGSLAPLAREGYAVLGQLLCWAKRIITHRQAAGTAHCCYKEGPDNFTGAVDKHQVFHSPPHKKKEKNIRHITHSGLKAE